MESRLIWLVAAVQLVICVPATTATNRPRVLILGGGMAGLQAAQVFNDNGMTDFLILEADSRLGGRMLAMDLPGLQVADSWFRVDKRSNAPDPFRSLGDRCNLAYSFLDWSQFRAVDDKGNVVTDEALASQSRLSQAVSDLKAAWTRGDFQGEDDLSLQAALRIYGWHPKTPADWAIEYYWFQLEYVAHPSALSAKRWLYLHGDGGLYGNQDYQRVRNSYFGNRVIVNCLADSFRNGDNDPRILLNTLVTEIQYSDNGVTVITSDGSRYVGDYALITFSLGVLQHGDVTFTPELPFWKKLAINRFVMTPITTVYAIFNTLIKRAVAKRYMYVSDSRGLYHWQLELLSTIEQQFNHSQSNNVFMLWPVGEDALRVEKQPINETTKEIAELYRQQFGPTTPTPEVRVCNYSLNPLYYGGVAIFPLGAANKDLDQLRAPIRNRLFFAGDAYQHNLYARAALVSGNETAAVMMTCMNGGSCGLPKMAVGAETCSSGGERVLLQGTVMVVLLYVTQMF